ncbi:6-deoxyerythronolide-B synthase EryA1, modules 1 and 2 [Candidatus Entotheonellaceae bacterium PAL068K]
MNQNPANRDYPALMKQAVLELRGLRAKLNTLERAKSEPLAIIGVGCRFPGGIDTPDVLWQRLGAGVDAIVEVPPDRWDVDAYYDPDPEALGKMYVRHGGFLPQVDAFDPHFFNLSPREAVSLDPQQRLLLEVSWEALESAGIAPDQLSGSQTGVFIGIALNDYFQRLLARGQEHIDAYTMMGVAHSTASGRLSFLLGLQGPNLALDTACSSSLVAVHLACQHLRNRECDMALAGGVNLILAPEISINHSRARMLAPGGRCKTFDAAADGFVRSEGCGVIVLKRLSDALADNDLIWALIRGSAVNQDGRTSGLTVPNGLSQQAVIRQALANGDVAPDQVRYIEAHGTGTMLGDPIEVGALGAVFGKLRSPDRPLIIGSVKTNIGHTEGAAGIAGLIKVVLSLQHGDIPPHLHFHTPNPHIDWEHLPVRVPTESMPWPDADRRIAGVNSFGFSGTNAHVILEAAPEPAAAGTDMDRPLHLLTLSAKTEAALRALAQRSVSYLSTRADVPLGDICFTANTGRALFPHRLSVVAASVPQMRQQLSAFLAGRPLAGVASGQRPAPQAPRVAFLFSGQGTQSVDMGRQLYDTQPSFRQAVQRCAEILRPYLEVSLLDVLYPSGARDCVPASRDLSAEADAPGAHDHLLHQTAYTQPALFSVEYALSALWHAWGLRPQVVMGHSVGEYVAACVAGVFSLEEGLRLIAERGRLMQALPQDGDMVAVRASEARVAAAIAPCAQEVSIAAINGPESVVISGRRQAVAAVLSRLETEGVKKRQLTVSHAFHSPLMEPMLTEFAQVAQQVIYAEPQLALVSNVTGQLATAEVQAPEYWVRHVREAVRFADGMATLHEQGCEVFVEIGPQPTLLGMGRQCLEPLKHRTRASAPTLWLPSLRRGQPDWQVLLQSLGALYCHGVCIDWAGFDRDYARRKVVLPTYPFQRQRYWVDTMPGPSTATSVLPSQVRTPTLDLLTQGDTVKLVQHLETAGKLSADQIELLDLLVQRHQREMTTAAVHEWLYEIAWQPHAVASSAEAGAGKVADSWLILADAGGRGRRLAAALRQRGAHCLEVYAAKGNQTTASAGCHLNPLHPDAFERLLADLATRRTPVRNIVHLWSLDAARPKGLSVAALEHAQALSCGSLLHLVQALVEQQLSEPPSLWVVTQGAVPVRDADNDPTAPLAVAQSPVWGLGKVVALEYPALWGGLIDLPPQSNTDTTQALLHVMQQPDGENQIALRHGQRYVARLVRSQGAVSEEIACRADGSYLITGGLGVLGLRVAQWLVERGARHLVLTGRRGAARPEARAGVRQLEDAGARVLVVAADVSQRHDVARLLDHTAACMPPLRGLVYAAGVSGYQTIPEIDFDAFAAVLRAKVLGTWLLHQMTQDLTLDFFVVFSSIASVWGSKGQAHYAAANQFLDALAHYRRRGGQPALSVNWGPWAGGGMATDEMLSVLAPMGVGALPPRQAMAALGCVMGAGHVQTAVSRMDWRPFKTLYAAARPRRLFEHIEVEAPDQDEAQPGQQSDILQRLQAAPTATRYNLMMAHVQETVAAILRLDAAQLPHPERGFTDMGMDSLMAVELRQQLAASLAVDLPATLAFESPTIRQLTAYLAEEVMGWTPQGRDESAGADDAAARAKAVLDITQMSEDEFETAVANELTVIQALLEND